MAEADSTWRDIEPLLKWAAVAYALGFLTIMIHTARLGIPVIQVIEPINIWVGLPLAVVVYFIDKLAAIPKAALIRFRQEVARVSAEWRSVKDSNPTQDVIGRIAADAIDTALDASIPSVALRSWTKSKFTTFLEQQIATTTTVLAVKWISGLLLLSQIVIGFRQFVITAAQPFLIVIACAAYIWIVYPVIPQTYGGGKPLEVRLIVNAAKIPKNEPSVRRLFIGSRGAPDKSGETVATVPLILYYETGDTYYVKSDRGPIISLSRDVVEGLIYPETSAERGAPQAPIEASSTAASPSGPKNP